MLPAATNRVGSACAATIAAVALALPASALADIDYGAPVQYAGGPDPWPIDAGDLDGDGDLDLVTGNFNSNAQGFSVFVNGGAGTFAAPSHYPSGGNAETLDLGTLDAGVDLDLASGTNNEASVLFGGAGTTLGPTLSFGSWVGQSRGTGIADFNRDGDDDIVVAEDEQKLVYLRGKGDGTFKPQRERSLKPKSADELSVAKLNDDKRPDVVIGGDGKRAVLVLRARKGKQPFKKPDAFRGLKIPSDIATGDLNGDGRADVVESGGNAEGKMASKRGGPSQGIVAVMIGHDDAHLSKPENTKLPGQGGATGLDVADLNGDGDLDVVVARPNGTVAILKGKGNGKLKDDPQIVDLGATSYAQNVVAARLNADDALDLALTNGNDNEITVLLHD
jgi:FG-GAP-like repeat